MTSFTNIVLVLFTFWLGLVVQNWVAEKNANVSGALANAEYVKNVKPPIDSLGAKYNAFLTDFVQLNDKLDDTAYIIQYYEENDTVMWHFFADVVKTASKVLLYINDTATMNSIISKGALLSGLVVIHDFCYINESQQNDNIIENTNNLNEHSTRTPSEWPELENRIRDMFNSIEYVSLIGTNPSKSIELLQQYKELYTKLVQSDNPNTRTSEKIYFSTQAFLLAVEINKILNANRTFLQKDESIWRKITSSPWSVLFLCVLIISLLIGRLPGRKEEAEVTNNSNRQNDSRFARLQGQITDLENRMESIDGKEGLFDQFVEKSSEEQKTTREETQKMAREMQNALNDIRRSIEELRAKQEPQNKI